jgi:hypothetical protein
VDHRLRHALELCPCARQAATAAGGIADRSTSPPRRATHSSRVDANPGRAASRRWPLQPPQFGVHRRPVRLARRHAAEPRLHHDPADAPPSVQRRDNRGHRKPAIRQVAEQAISLSRLAGGRLDHRAARWRPPIRTARTVLRCPPPTGLMSDTSPQACSAARMAPRGERQPGPAHPRRTCTYRARLTLGPAGGC